MEELAVGLGAGGIVIDGDKVVASRVGHPIQIDHRRRQLPFTQYAQISDPAQPGSSGRGLADERPARALDGDLAAIGKQTQRLGDCVWRGLKLFCQNRDAR